MGRAIILSLAGDCPVRPERTVLNLSLMAGLLRIGLVGCGEVCEHKHLPALGRVRGARVVALADTDPFRLAKVGDRYGVTQRFAGIDAMLDARVVDLVGVLTPPGQHVGGVVAALRAGCDVLVEKPLALTTTDVDTMLGAAATAQRRVLMGFHMRWHRLIRQAHDAIRQDAIGRPESIRTTWNSPRPDAGIPAWKCERTTGGGAIVELGVHLFDLWRYLLSTEVVSVSATSRHGRRHDENSAITAVLANGAVASAHLSERTSHEIELEICGDRGRLRVACQRFDGFEWFGIGETRGMMGPRRRGLMRTARELPRGLATMRSLGDYGDSYRGQWQHLVDAVTHGATPECTLEDGRAALRVVHAATAAAEQGAFVRVEQAPSIVTALRVHT